MPFQIRALQTHDEFRECLNIQKHVWGKNFVDATPPTLMTVLTEIGGLTAGAFDNNNKLIGFVFCFPGIRQNKVVYWSQKLAVLEEYRGQGLGIKLKLFQRDFLLKKGIGDIYWTYDPLVARNAHINLNILGAEVEAYFENYYAVDNQNKLHKGIGTDRFLVHWHLKKARTTTDKNINLKAKDCLEVLNVHKKQLPEIKSGVVEIPHDIEHILSNDLSKAQTWRNSTRRIFQHYLSLNYRIQQFFKQKDRCFYIIEK